MLSFSKFTNKMLKITFIMKRTSKDNVIDNFKCGSQDKIYSELNENLTFSVFYKDNKEIR